MPAVPPLKFARLNERRHSIANACALIDACLLACESYLAHSLAALIRYFAVVALMVTPRLVWGDDAGGAHQEYKIKAAVLYKAAKFVTWPPEYLGLAASTRAGLTISSQLPHLATVEGGAE